MIKLVWTPWGENIALGVYAPNTSEAERIFNICYNYGLVSSDTRLRFLKSGVPSFGYFKTTWKDLTKGLKIEALAVLLPKTQKQIDKTREDFLANEKEFVLSI